jgi:spectinomycin phosphotransferase
VLRYLAEIHGRQYSDPVSRQAAEFLLSVQAEVRILVARTDSLAQRLQNRPLEWVVCHADAHAANLLIDDRGKLYLVDWDDLIYAPKERDLMFPGGAQGFIGRSLEEEQALFYQGYGLVEVDSDALAYYRCERIIQDIWEYCEQIFRSEGDGEDRAQGLEYLMSNFLPGGTIEAAYQTGISRLPGE